MQTVVLIGAEQVQRAGHSIESAAASFRNSVSNLEAALQQHQRFMDDWLTRLEAVMSKSAAPWEKQG